MSKYTAATIDPHHTNPTLGILLTNLGTPAQATAAAIRHFLAEFLSDPRVIELPRACWWPILHGIILRTRPRRLVHSYQSIWTSQGSPLLSHTLSLAEQLQSHFHGNGHEDIRVVAAMRYGNPGIREGLEKLREARAERIIVLPLYPQYSATTTASTFDAIADVLKSWRYLPTLHFIQQYADHPAYIDAISRSVTNWWQKHGKPQKLLFSFHGLPKKYFKRGDPYYCYCHLSAQRIAKQLDLGDDEWGMVFQSRIGTQQWLQPYCDKTIKQLAKKGCQRLDVICPGFPIDCLETLEEINIQNRELFLQHGGKEFHYIPALNAEDSHVNMLAQIITTSCAALPKNTTTQQTQSQL